MSLAMLDDLERDFGVHLHWVRSKEALARWHPAKAKRDLKLEEEARAAFEKETRRMAIVKNFAIVKQVNNRVGEWVTDTTMKRCQYALYRLWRYLDVDKVTMAEFVRENAPDLPYGDVQALSDLFADIFAENCQKADKCVLRPFLPKSGPHPCLLDGCGKLTKWQGKRRGKFCSREHSEEYGRMHPDIFVSPEVRRHQMQTWDRILKRIKSGRLEYQSQFTLRADASPGSNSRDRARHCIRLEREGLITRKRVFFNGRWTFRLKLTPKGMRGL
jgi:hypothetical protein